MLILSASLADENLEELTGTISAELKKIISEGPTTDELRKAIVNFEAEEFFSLETVDGLARKVGHFNDLLHDPLHFKKFMADVRKVTTKQVAEVAKKYFDPGKISVSFMGKRSPTIAKKLLEGFVRDLKGLKKQTSKIKPLRATIKPFKWSGEPSTKTSPQRAALSNGITILSRVSRETPTVSVRVAALGGIRAEPDNKQGALELMSGTWSSGTKDLSEEEVQRKIEGMAASIGAFGGRNSVGVSLEVLKSFEAEAAGLLKEIIGRPNFSAEIIKREKQVLLEQLKSRKDNPGQVCIQQFMSTLFEGHPYSKDLSGEPEHVIRVEQPDVRDIWDRCVVTNNVKVGISGDADLALWKDVFEGLDRPKGKKFEQVFPLEKLTGDEVKFVKMEKEQTHIVVGYRGLTLKDDDRFALQVIQSILAGQGGRLFLELRDKNSLAYTVSPLRMEGIDTGYFGAYIACSPEKAKKSIEMLRAELDKISSVAVGEKELERSKNYIIGRHDIDLQRNSSIASALVFDDLYDIDFEEIYKFPEYIRKVTSKDVLRVAQRILSQHEVVSVAGKSLPESI
jgi:zinc protease